MGKSNSIQNAEKADENFKNFLQNIQNDLVEKFEKEGEQFETEVKKFYTDSKYDMLLIAEGHKWDYHLMSECGVSTLQEKVKKMVSSFFGITELEEKENLDEVVEVDKTENGSIKMPISENTMNALNIIKVFKGLAIASAVNFLIGIFDVLSDKLEISAQHNYSAQTIAPGLKLHVDFYSATYSNESFLKNDRIIESYVRFKLIYSYALADVETTMNTITNLAGEIAQMENQLANYDVNLFKMMADINIDINQINLYQERSNMMHNYLNNARKEKDNLIAEHMASSSIEKNGEQGLRTGLRLPQERIAIMRQLQNHYQ